MALERTQGLVYRLWFAGPNAFADWTQPTAAEMNQNLSNDPDGVIFNLTCALDTDSSTFDLGDAEIDDSTSFCQLAGSGDRMSENPEVVYGVFRSREKALASDADIDIANLAFNLLAYRGVEGFAIMAVGRGPEDEVEVGDPLKIVGVTTDHAVDTVNANEPLMFTQNFAPTGDVAWNVRAA